MDPSLLNFPGPSTYRLPPSLQHQQHPNSLPGQPIHPGHLQNSHPHIHPSGQPHLPNSSQYSLPPSGTTSFPSTPSSSSSRAPDVESTEGPDIPSDPRGAPTTGPLVEPHQELDEFLESFWMRQMDGVEREEQDGKVNVSLPLARIKKVMKSDEEMISAEVPIMFSKACEVFISELTCRAWLIAESHKRRTLQKSDVAAAIAHSDMFDFLIDIVPRDGDNPDTAGDGAESKAQSVGDDEGQEDGEEDAEDMYREYVDGDG